MKKNLLALSIAAMVGGLSGVANAAVTTDTVGGRLVSNAALFGKLQPVAAPVADANGKLLPVANNLYQAGALVNNASGVGHVLFVPYFTTQGNQMTLLNLVNNDRVNGKAVKLRFRGAANSDDLFDISIFLSPGDAWTAYVNNNGGLSALTTNDTTCTLPSAEQIKETAGKFVVTRVLNNAAEETREGYVEILNMADIPPLTVNPTTNSALYNAVKHTSVNGVWKAPCTQAVMDAQAQPLVNDPTSPNDPITRGYSWPTGGLSLNWTIVDTSTNASFSGEAVALRAVPQIGTVVYANAAAAANLVFSPQTTERVINAVDLTADPLLQMVNGPVRPASYDFPDLSTPYTGGSNSPEVQAAELADALATFSVSNEYITDPGASFATDWVFSMPTRRYAVALDYEAKVMRFNNGVNAHFTAANTSLNKEKTRICVDAGQLVAFDREENSRTSFVISPNDIMKFCGEASVLTFNGKASVLGAKVATNAIDTKFVDGWLRIGTPGLGNGLPVVGYAVGKAVGANASNFGGTWMHRTNRVAPNGF